MAQKVKNLPVIQETRVQSLCWEDPLEKRMADYPLQYSCLENSIERGAWWATVYGVALTLSLFTLCQGVLRSWNKEVLIP